MEEVVKQMENKEMRNRAEKEKGESIAWIFVSSLIFLFCTFGMHKLALDDPLHLMNVIRAIAAINGDGLARMSVNVIFHIG